MILLKSVRLCNFRAVEDATFEPLRSGITGLSGPNGVGKSSFLDGTLWALFGSLPEGVPQSLLRRQSSTLDEECFVEVVFEHEGQEIIVTRSLQGKNGTAVLNTWLDGQEKTVKSIKTGENWIKRRLGIDAKGFKTAVLIPQKQLDMLVNAKPTERRALIEELSGVSRMSAALDAARKDYNAAKKLLEADKSNADDVKFAQENVLLCESFLADVKNELRAVEEQRDQLSEALSIVTSQRQAIMDKVQEGSKLKEDVSRARTSVQIAQASYESAQNRLERALSAAPDSWDQDAHKSAQEALREAQEVLSAAMEQQSQMQNSLAQKRGSVEALTQEKNNILLKNNQINEWIQKTQSNMPTVTDEEISELQSSIERARAEREEVRDKINNVQFSILQIQESISTLQKSHDSSCPTCHTHLDDPTSLIDSMNQSIKVMTEQVRTLEEDMRLIQDTGTNLAAEIEKKQTIRAEVNRRLEQITEGTHRIEEGNVRISVIDDRTVQLEEDFMKDESTLEAIKNEVAKFSALRDERRDFVNNLDQAESAWKEKISAESERSEASKNIQFAEEALLIAQSALDDAVIPGDDEVSDIEDRLQEASAAYHAATVSCETVRGRLQLAEEKLDRAQADFRREEEKFALRNEMLVDLEHKKAIAGVLEEFRLNQISRIAPELADTASTLISQMTNGMYTEIRLDENFTPFVVNDEGEIRPATILSGGEVSVVALALRIAIRDMISNDASGLLWLDEVLTAQDAGRRQSLIETLRNIGDRQIIMINHTQGADDIVDTNVRLARGDNGTVIDNS